VGLWPGGVVSNGAWQIATMLLLVVSNDTFGYLVGASFGKHPMAPKISPKKIVGRLRRLDRRAPSSSASSPAVFVLDKPWWVGVVLAVGMVAAATTGDLAESMVKRELGIKDMSSILPGHGGVMDRLDSIVFASPAAFILFTAVSGAEHGIHSPAPRMVPGSVLPGNRPAP
jgi:phosphatidate cytidylyltransferase